MNVTSRTELRAPAPAGFRDVAGCFPTGITVLTCGRAGEQYAKTVSSFAPLSLDPALVGVAVDRRSPLVQVAVDSRRFAVSMLREDQAAVSSYFAAPLAQRIANAPVDLHCAPTGGAILSDCLGWFDCVLSHVADGGDHAYLVGDVLALQAFPGEPLVHFRGHYRSLSPSPETTS